MPLSKALSEAMIEKSKQIEMLIFVFPKTWNFKDNKFGFVSNLSAL